MSCPTHEQLQMYYDAELPVQRRREVESHVADCPACREFLAELAALSQLLNVVDLPELPSSVQQRMQSAWLLARQTREAGLQKLAGFASAAAAIVIVGFWAVSPGQTHRTNTSVATAGPSYVEAVAMLPPLEQLENPNAPYVQVAQWMASDLSPDMGR